MDNDKNMFAIIYTGKEENDIPRLYYYYSNKIIINNQTQDKNYEEYLTYCKRLVGLQQITTQLFDQQNNKQQWFTLKLSKLLVRYESPYYFILQSEKADYIQLNESINFILQAIYDKNSCVFEEKTYKKDIQPPYPLDDTGESILPLFLQSFYQCSEICRYHGFLAPKTSISLFLFGSLIIKQIKNDLQCFNNIIVTWQKRIIVTDCNSILSNYIIVKEAMTQLTEDKIKTFSDIYQLPEELYIQQLKYGDLIIYILTDQKTKRPQISQLQSYSDRLKQYQQPNHPIINYQMSQIIIDADYSIYGVDYAGYLRKYGQQIESKMLLQRKNENNIRIAQVISNTKQQNIQVLKAEKHGQVYALYQNQQIVKTQDAEKDIEIWVNM